MNNTDFLFLNLSSTDSKIIFEYVNKEPFFFPFVSMKPSFPKSIKNNFIANQILFLKNFSMPTNCRNAYINSHLNYTDILELLEYLEQE